MGPLLTCWDSLAAAAASPVSMEATLVPSRTGLSCLGTDGPTLAAGEKVNLPRAATHCLCALLGSPGPAPVCPQIPGTSHNSGSVSMGPNLVWGWFPYTSKTGEVRREVMCSVNQTPPRWLP